jgi:spermidine synthase
MSKTILLLAAIEMLLAIAVVFADRKAAPSLRTLVVVAAVAAVAIFAIRLPSRNETFRNALPLRQKVLAFEEGPLATVSVTEDSLGYREIAVDNVGVAGTSRVMLTDQKSLAHLPSLILDDPSSVLTVGFGSGGASYSYTLYPELKNVHCVEIASEVPQPDIQRLLTASNNGLLDRLDEVPQFKIIQADARSYLRFTPQQYDSIATDCTDLRYKSNANLYDLQYFQLCRERLTDDGMVVVWMPLGALTRDLFLTALNTFHEAFPDMHVWYFNNDVVHYILLAGFNKPLKMDYRKVVERISRSEISDDL